MDAFGGGATGAASCSADAAESWSIRSKGSPKDGVA